VGNLLQTGSDWLAAQRKAHLASPVTYCRGSDEVEVQATIGQTDFEIEDASGFRVQAHVTDFLILTEDLVLAGQKTLPEAGDRIKVPSDTETAVYEVMGLAGEPPYRFSDPYRKTLRIHTKLVDTE
jgi:hypothetical protein